MILFHQTLMQKRREKSYLTSPFFLSIIAIINFSLKRFISFVLLGNPVYVWGIERSGFFNGREKWAKGFENQRV